MPKNYIRHQIAAILLGLPLCAQPPGGAPPPVAKTAAPVDLTGYWVSIVTEDWRYRMVMPAAGDYQGVPMTAAASKWPANGPQVKTEIPAKPTVRQRSCASPNAFTLHGRTIKPCAWIRTRVSRLEFSISATGRLPRGHTLCKGIPPHNGNSTVLQGPAFLETDH